MLSRLKFSAFILPLVLASTLLQAAELNHPAPALALKGTVRFVNFWASWCAPCQVELPELNRLAAAYKGKKLEVLAVNVDENRADGRKALARLGLSTPSLEILWDNKSKIVSAYNVEAMPSSFIIDARGVIRYIHTGFHAKDPKVWREEIELLLKN